MRRLGPSDQGPENRPCAAHIGHKKSKTASNKSRRRMMASWHLAEAGHASTCVMKVASVKSRRKAKESDLGGGWTLIDIGESHLEGFVSLVLKTRHRHPKIVFLFGPQN